MSRRNKHRSRGRDRYDDMFEEEYDDSLEEQDEEYEEEDVQEQEVNQSSQQKSVQEERRKAASEERDAWESIQKEVQKKDSSKGPEIEPGENVLKKYAGRCWGGIVWGFQKIYTGGKWTCTRLWKGTVWCFRKLIGCFRKLCGGLGFLRRVPRKVWLGGTAVLLLAILGGAAIYFLKSGTQEVAKVENTEKTPSPTESTVSSTATNDKIPEAVPEKPVEEVSVPPTDDLSSLPGLDFEIPVESASVESGTTEEKDEIPTEKAEEYDLNRLGLGSDLLAETPQPTEPTDSVVPVESSEPLSTHVPESTDTASEKTLAEAIQAAPGVNTDHILSHTDVSPMGGNVSTVRQEEKDPYALSSSIDSTSPKNPENSNLDDLAGLENIGGLGNASTPNIPSKQERRENGKSSVLINGSEGIAKDNVWVVRTGDNYWDISQKVYGTGGYYKAIAQYNSTVVSNPNHLTAGTRLRLPEVSFLRKTYPSLCPADNSVEVSGNQYVVQDGDTLSDIARVRLGSASRWPEIYRMNRDRLNNRFDLLPPGTMLVLPEKEGEVVASEAGMWK